jgi:hypothetical protein
MLAMDSWGFFQSAHLTARRWGARDLAESQDIVMRKVDYSGVEVHGPTDAVLGHWPSLVLAFMVALAWLHFAGDSRVLANDVTVETPFRESDSLQLPRPPINVPAGSPELWKFRLLGGPVTAR